MERPEAFTEQEWADLEALSDGASISDLLPSQHEYCESTVLGNGKAPAEYHEQIRRSQPLTIGSFEDVMVKINEQLGSICEVLERAVSSLEKIIEKA